MTRRTACFGAITLGFVLADDFIGQALKFISGFFPAGCGENDKPDFVLTGNPETDSSMAENATPALQSMLKKGEGSLTFGLSDKGILTLAAEKKSGDTKLKVIQPNGKSGYFVWGLAGLSPVVKVTDENGATLSAASGKKLQYAILPFLSPPAAGKISSLDASSVFASDLVKILIAILAVWLGFNIAGWILGALGYLIVVALLILLASSVAGFFEPVRSWVFEYTGIDLRNVGEFLKELGGKVLEIIQKALEDLG